MDRVIYQEWIVELGRDPSLTWEEAARGVEVNDDIIRAVREALTVLDADEADLIGRFYFQGMKYSEISRLTGRPVYRLEALHDRAVRRLRERLSQILRGYPGITVESRPECPLCNHFRVEEINRLIRAKGERETWRPIIKRLRNEFGIVIKTPQLLIGHRKYHMS